jgi:hypothetical protein|nr:MAG TPA: hypothetical protein [Caudoviricetes sp.]
MSIISKNKSKPVEPYKVCIDDFTLGDKEIVTSWRVLDNTHKVFRVSVILGNNRKETRIGDILESELSLKRTKKLIEENKQFIINFVIDWILEIHVSEKFDKLCPAIDILVNNKGLVITANEYRESKEIEDLLEIDRAFFENHYVKAEAHLCSKENNLVKKTLLIYTVKSIFKDETVIYPNTIYKAPEGDYVVESVKRLE